MPPRIHSSAVVGREVELGDDVEVGPFCQLEGKVRIGAGSRLIGHVSIFGETVIGEACVFHPNAVIGDEPQDVSYTGGTRKVRIGNHCVFREGTTVHRGSEKGEITIVGDDLLLMSNAHIAHDCRIGNQVIIANGALLGGWVEVGDRAMISGNCVIQQYTRIGRISLMRGGSRTSRDIPPFCICDGDHVRIINAIGLKRAGFKAEAIQALRRAFAELFGVRKNLTAALERIEQRGKLTPEVAEMVEFIRSSKQGVNFGGEKPSFEESD